MRLECTAENAAAVAAQVRRTVAETVDVAPILAAVRERGDAAVIDYEARFGGAAAGNGDAPAAGAGAASAARAGHALRVSPDELGRAVEALDPAVRAGLETAIANVRAVAEAGLDPDDAAVTNNK